MEPAATAIGSLRFDRAGQVFERRTRAPACRRRVLDATGYRAFPSVSRLQAATGSAFFLLIAPGVAAGLVPWALTGWDSAGWPALVQALGAALIVAGAGALLHAFVRFVTEGRGTPAPVAPTERLVVGGLYRHVRNPMYLAVAATITGQALLLGRPVLLAYAVVFISAVAVFVRWYEEPTLRRSFGSSYEAYLRNVPGWWPRRRPWGGE
jgi:protein-S-isoprenylcysteine O-methyltransferase Ste14